jgi:signal transduction histidine kinase
MNPRAAAGAQPAASGATAPAAARRADAAAGARSAPSIRARLANALTLWSVAWGLAVGAAVWLAATHEVDELLDDALQSSAELLAALVVQGGPAVAATTTPASGGGAEVRVAPPTGATGPNGSTAADRFAWQVIGADGALQLRSVRAPDVPWRPTPHAGFGDVTDWRLFGLALGSDGRMLYAAQTRGEREEARMEVAMGAVLAALAVGLLGHVWLRERVRAELQPLENLSARLQSWDIDAPGGATRRGLGEPERRELEPVHHALQALATRLAARIANEQAFSAHAAHALRTPLAGIDAQLAVALRECPPALRERLQRVRGAAGRLQGVVAALLSLFRSGAPAVRVPIDLPTLLARLPAPSLAVQVQPGARVDADPDLLAAALLNLLDNAQRHGARHAWVESPAPGRLRVRDDGPGIDAARRAALQAELDSQAYDGATGLGLMLADRVARAHGGRVTLCASQEGFVVEIDLGTG